MKNIDRLRIAYKKLKATVFFDKTQLPLRDQLVLYEENIEEKLSSLEQALFLGIDWDETEKEILDSVGVLVYPKRLKPVDEDMAIFNSDSIAIEMDKPQYFIDLSPEGQLLGVLWILEFGAVLDKNAGDSCDEYEGMYPHSYGNRLRKNLISRDWYEKENSYYYYPYMFLPQDIYLAMTYAEISSGKPLLQPNDLDKRVKKAFIRLNYPLADDGREVYELNNITSGWIEGLSEKASRRSCFVTYVDSPAPIVHTCSGRTGSRQRRNRWRSAFRHRTSVQHRSYPC